MISSPDLLFWGQTKLTSSLGFAQDFPSSIMESTAS